MTCRDYATDAGCNTLRDLLKSLLNVHTLEEGKITVKACAAQQTPTYMLGYIQKDKMRTEYDVSCSCCYDVDIDRDVLCLFKACTDWYVHFFVLTFFLGMQIIHSGISEAVLLNANDAYQQIRTTYTENMIIITKVNSYKLIWQFKQRHLMPLDPHPEPVLYWLTGSNTVKYWMMQTGEYMPDPKFSMTSGLGIPVQHCCAMMYMISNPTKVSMENILDVFHYIQGRTWAAALCGG